MPPPACRQACHRCEFSRQRSPDRQVGFSGVGHQVEAEHRHAVERQQLRCVLIASRQHQRDLALAGVFGLAAARQRRRQRRTADIALRADGKAGAAVAILRRGSHDVEARVGKEVGITPGAFGEAVDHWVLAMPRRQCLDQRHQVHRHQRGVDIAGQIVGKIAQRPGRADRRAGQPAERQAVDLEQPFAQPERRINRIGGQSGRVHRSGLYLQVEVAVGKADGADIADEQRGECG